MNCNLLSKKIQRWFNDNTEKTDKDFTFRFRGKESLGYMKHFPRLIELLVSNIKDGNVLKRLYEIHYQSIYLRKLLSYTVRITDFNEEDLLDMKNVANVLFKACCSFEGKISPSLWTLCIVAPIHAENCFKMYGLGLGCNTMEGREQKHQMVGKYAEKSTVQNRWPLIFRHELSQQLQVLCRGISF